MCILWHCGMYRDAIIIFNTRCMSFINAIIEIDKGTVDKFKLMLQLQHPFSK